MSIVFNLIIIGLVLLIAYWWANQGLFSAILHLLCVIAAGAIAFAIWEPLVEGVLLRGTFFDYYAWGVGLVVPFVLILLILRVIFDRMCGANVALPRWANMTFGMVVGLLSGILTMGVFVIGAGFIQSGREIMGFTGYARSGRNAEVAEIESMWLPVHKLTGQFYSMLSAGSLYPSFTDMPMSQYYPAVEQVSVSLHRDTFANGRGKTSLRPSDAVVGKVIMCEQCNPKRLAVEVTFEAGARDFGEQLTLSAAQIRLIGEPPKSAGPFAEAKVAFPVAFTQHSGYHRFDDVSHYISSEPGQQRAHVLIEFNAGDLGTQPPRFIQIRGIRFRVPKAMSIDPSTYALALNSSATAADAAIALSPNGIDITSAIKQANDIRPIQVSVNKLPAGIEITKVNDKNWISGGDGEFDTVGADRPGRGLSVEGILQPGGTRIVQVDVSRGSRANIFKDSLLAAAGTENPAIQLVDDKGRTYVPIGFMHAMPGNKTRIKVDFENEVKTYKEFPLLPTSGTHQLRILFRVTDGATIAGMVLGTATVGTCNVLVQDPDRKTNQGDTGFGGETAGG